MNDDDPLPVDAPRLFNVFDLPKIKSVRAVSSLKQKIKVEKIWNHLNDVKKVRTSGKDVAKFEVGKGEYLLLFPSGYVQIYGPNEERIREVLRSFRDELFKEGLLR